MGRKKEPRAPDGFVWLLPTEIVCDPERNSRKEYPTLEASDSPDERLSDAQLDASIEAKGVLQAPKVRRIGDAWYAVFGYRRIASAVRMRPLEKLLCSILAPRGDEIDQELDAMFENLAENMHRRDLQPWERAEFLYQMVQLRPTLTMMEVSARTGLTHTYCANLVRLRRKAHPEIWKQYQRWGTTLRINFDEVLRIAVIEPPDAQLEEWNRVLAAHESKHGKRGREAKPGPSKLRKMLAAVDSIWDRSSEFRRGLKLGLAIAIGTEKWPYGADGSNPKLLRQGASKQTPRKEQRNGKKQVSAG